MKILLLTAFLAAIGYGCPPARAQAPDFVPGNRAVGAVQIFGAGGTLLPGANALPTLDGNGAAFQGVVAITPGTPTTAMRSLGYICSTAGNVTLTLADASTITLPIATAGGAFQTLPFAVTGVALGSGTAGSFWGLK